MEEGEERRREGGQGCNFFCLSFYFNLIFYIYSGTSDARWETTIDQINSQHKLYHDDFEVVQIYQPITRDPRYYALPLPLPSLPLPLFLLFYIIFFSSLSLISFLVDGIQRLLHAMGKQLIQILTGNLLPPNLAVCYLASNFTDPTLFPSPLFPSRFSRDLASSDIYLQHQALRLAKVAPHRRSYHQ